MTRYGDDDSNSQVVCTEDGADILGFLSNNRDRRAFLSVSETDFDWDADLGTTPQLQPCQATVYLTATECFELASALVNLGGQLCRKT